MTESQEDFLLCKVLQQMFCTCHSQLKVKNLLLRKAKILQNAKIAHQPSCISRFHQLLSDLKNRNIKQKSLRSVTHETSLSVMRRAHKSLATGLPKCSKPEEGCVLNKLSDATNLCLEVEFLPNYPEAQIFRKA